ncbi:hypothetical protein J132_11155 [Termitomyces sp. J132]|nr:hypothetical protein J132_11155 [Termitomyces sp. J132]
MNVLNEIFEDWCIVARAKFNITKTEILPIGTKVFHEEILRERKLRHWNNRIPDNIHIVEDGTSIRILGACFGNEADLSIPWSNVLAKIDRCIANWEKSQPTMGGCRHIA